MNNIIIYSTLHDLLYPPLKGFSHSLDHVRIRDKPLPAALQGVLKPRAFTWLHKGYTSSKMRCDVFMPAFVSDLKIYRKELSKAGIRCVILSFLEKSYHVVDKGTNFKFICDLIIKCQHKEVSHEKG